MLLRRANLPTQARLSVQAAAGNSLHFKGIERALRAMEDELLVHDETRRPVAAIRDARFGSRMMANGASFPWTFSSRVRAP